MNFIYSVIAFMILPLISCVNATFINTPVASIQNKELLKSFKNYKESLTKKRSPIFYDDGKSATNCEAYFLLNSESNVNESQYNQLVKSEYLICDTLQILSKLEPVNLIKSTQNNMGKSLLTKLDLRSFRSSLAMISTEESHTLEALYPNNTSYTGNEAVLDTEDWFFSMVVVAEVKINNNSSFDWIIWVADESKLGSYRSYTTIIIYDPIGRDSFRANSYP